MFPSPSKARRLWIKAKNTALDVLFPPICLNCRRRLEIRNKMVCDDCLSLIRINNTLFCPICRARLADNKKICHYQSQYLLAAAGNYDDLILQNLIHHFKYKGFKTLAPILGEMLLKYMDNSNLTGRLTNYLIIPTPLHSRREKERGFNQSKLLAEILCRQLNLSLVEGLKRAKNNKPQIEFKGIEARSKNVADCFEMKNSDFIQGRNIILVDDVFTSGATAGEAVKILKNNGAGKIIVLTLAKA